MWVWLGSPGNASLSTPMETFNKGEVSSNGSDRISP